MKRFVDYNELLEEGIFANRMDVVRKVATGFPAPLAFGSHTLRWSRVSPGSNHVRAAIHMKKTPGTADLNDDIPF